MIIAIRDVNAKLSEWWLLFLAESLREYCLWEVRFAENIHKHRSETF